MKENIKKQTDPICPHIWKPFGELLWQGSGDSFEFSPVWSTRPPRSKLKLASIYWMDRLDILYRHSRSSVTECPLHFSDEAKWKTFSEDRWLQSLELRSPPCWIEFQHVQCFGWDREGGGEEEKEEIFRRKLEKLQTENVQAVGFSDEAEWNWWLQSLELRSHCLIGCDGHSSSRTIDSKF